MFSLESEAMALHVSTIYMAIIAHLCMGEKQQQPENTNLTQFSIIIFNLYYFVIY